MADDRNRLDSQTRTGDGEIISVRSGYLGGSQVRGMTRDLGFRTQDGILVYKLGYRAGCRNVLR